MPESGERWPFRFECRRSGNCCARPEGVVRVADDEVGPMAVHVGLSATGFRARYLVPGPDGAWLLKQGADGACALLVRDGGRAACSVWPARPRRCAEFPWWPELQQPGPALDEALRFCPGLVPSSALSV